LTRAAHGPQGGVYIERLWRSIKYELVYLHKFETVNEARSAIANYIDFYNTQRPHQSLGYKLPDNIYKEFEYVKHSNAKVESMPPFLGANNNSQIFCEKLS
jgi:transposase InsO family protein